MKSVILGIAMIGAFLVNQAQAADAKAAEALAQKSGCLACHGVEKKVLGPSYKEVAAKYKSDKGAEAKLVAKVKAGGSGVWGPVPMPPHPQVKDEDIKSTNSLNRILSTNVYSNINYPSGDNAAFDGYAINSNDTKNSGSYASW